MTPQELEMYRLTKRVILIENQAKGRETVINSLMDKNVELARRISVLDKARQRQIKLNSVVESWKKELENFNKPPSKPGWKFW